MRWIAWEVLLTTLLCGTVHAQVTGSKPGVVCHTTLFGGTTCAQQTPPAASQPASTAATTNTCRFGVSAAARLMCADPQLAAMDLTLVKTYRVATQRAAPDQKKVLLAEQAEWIRQRNEKCGLAGKDSAPLDQIRPAAQCLKNEIRDRIEALQGGMENHEANNPNACQSAKDAAERLICADPDLADADLALSNAYQDAEKAASVNSRKKLVQEQLAWVHARDERCGLAGKDKDAAPINELRNAKSCMEGEIKTRFSALLAASGGKSVSPPAAPNSQGVVVSPAVETAASAGGAGSGSIGSYAVHLPAPAQGPPNAVETELSRARKEFAADLGIQQWIDPKQLARNPYFYKGTVVGMVLGFERSISKNEAIFVHDGNRVFVAGVPSTIIQGAGELVLAARVQGNKGVIDSSGNEGILPALDYVGGAHCNSLCAGLAKLPVSEKQPYPTAGLAQ